MAKKHSPFDYETLVRYMLPTGMLDYFEVTPQVNVASDLRGA